MRMFLRGAAIVVSLVLAGCAGQPEIPFDKTSAGSVQTIGVLTPDMPEKPTVWLAGDVGQSFGLVGALVDVSMQSNRDSKMWAAMVQSGYVPRDAFLAAVESSLQARGFAAKTVVADRSHSGYLKTYPAPGDSKVDAYLDISFIGNGYGYAAAGIGSSSLYRPFAYLNCKLVRASDGSVLMQDTVLYNFVVVSAFQKDPKAVTISPDPAYGFVDFDTMMSDAKKAIAGEDTAFHQTTDSIAGLLH
jgi:hypothetical protein